MVGVHLSFKRGRWVEDEKSDFWLDAYLLKKLNNIKRIVRKGWDAVIVVDGKERSGKSTLGMAIAWYLSDTKLSIENFGIGIEDSAQKIGKLPDRSVLIVDEGSVVFSSKDATTRAQKVLMKILDVVGQKNMIFIICLPSFFDLNKMIAVRRSLFLCHVYPDESYNRGFYAFWGENRKKWLYYLGKKEYGSYMKPSPDFIGRFPNFKPPFYKKYLEEIKRVTLKEVIESAKDLKKVRLKAKIDEIKKKIYDFLYFKHGWSLEQMEEIGIDSKKTIKKILELPGKNIENED